MKIKMVLLIVALCALLSTTTYAATVKFDFGPMGETDLYGITIEPHPGYVGVDPTMMYGGQNYMGLDYGLVLETGGSVGGSHKESWHTRNSPTTKVLTSVWMDDAFFELEVPNGEYTVTLAGGNPAWDENEVRLWMEGNMYGSANPGSINENVYILDVCPLDRGDDGYLTWTVEDKEQHGTMSGYGFRTWGANNSHGPGEDTFMHMEVGYLLNQSVTVADGKLSVYGFKYDVGKLNFMEVTGEGIPVPVPEPATIILLSLGGMLLRRRRQ